MKTLVLVRHAKSDWGDARLDDHDRPLNARGERDAPRMAQKLAESGVTVDSILSSTATRAWTTARSFAAVLGVEPELREELYGADPSTVLRAAAESGVDSVMVVAHDPGLSALAGALSGEIARMPAGAVAVFHWEEDDWSAVDEIEPAAWTFTTPR